MNIGSSGAEEDEVVSAINTTPLVDVMLVLLIIFLITIPVVNQTVPVNLPKETNLPRQTKPENIEISVTKDGDVFWNTQLIPDNNALVERLKKVSVLNPQPDLAGLGYSPEETAALLRQIKARWKRWSWAPRACATSWSPCAASA